MTSCPATTSRFGGTGTLIGFNALTAGEGREEAIARARERGFDVDSGSGS